MGRRKPEQFDSSVFPKAWLKNCEKQPWCGYFESLLEAEIVVELPKITF